MLETIAKPKTLTKVEKRLNKNSARDTYKARDKTLTMLELEILTNLETLLKLEKRL